MFVTFISCTHIQDKELLVIAKRLDDNAPVKASLITFINKSSFLFHRTTTPRGILPPTIPMPRSPVDSQGPQILWLNELIVLLCCFVKKSLVKLICHSSQGGYNNNSVSFIPCTLAWEQATTVRLNSHSAVSLPLSGKSSGSYLSHTSLHSADTLTEIFTYSAQYWSFDR